MPDFAVNHCPVPKCSRKKAPKNAMCRKHWYLVPKPVRDDVNMAFRNAPGSDIHLIALRQAIREAIDAERAERERAEYERHV